MIFETVQSEVPRFQALESTKATETTESPTVSPLTFPCLDRLPKEENFCATPKSTNGDHEIQCDTAGEAREAERDQPSEAGARTRESREGGKV